MAANVHDVNKAWDFVTDFLLPGRVHVRQHHSKIFEITLYKLECFLESVHIHGKVYINQIFIQCLVKNSHGTLIRTGDPGP